MKNILVILFVALITTLSVNTQTKYSLSVYGGYSMPVADLAGDFPDTLGTSLLNFNKSSTLLSKSGFNIGAIGKYCVDTLGKAKLTAGLNYNSFSGSHDYTRPGGALNYKNKVNIFTISLGAEYNLLPKKKLNPFIGLELAANFFSGQIEATGDTTITYKRKSESRFGVIANAGAELKLNKSISAVFGVKYALANLFGKSSETTTTTTTGNITDVDDEGGTNTLNEIPLNDADNNSVKGKSLNYLQFYAGISFLFGDMLK
jgi:outer membrane protein W